MEDFEWFIQITVFCVYLLLFTFALGLFNLGPFKLGDLIHCKVNFGIKISDILILIFLNFLSFLIIEYGNFLKITSKQNFIIIRGIYIYIYKIKGSISKIGLHNYQKEEAWLL